MYYMYLDAMQIPIPPETMRTRIKSKNKVISLINTGEINILKTTGLTEISFKMMLPNSSYPFNQSTLNKSSKAAYYVDKLETLKSSSDPFQFIVVRMTDGGELLNMTNIKVTLENYSINEDAREGYDFYADIELKQYREWGAKKVTVSTTSDGTKQATTSTTRSTTGKSAIPTSVVTKQGDTLQTIVKKYFTVSNVASQLSVVKKLNKIAIPAVLAAGTTLKIQETKNSGSNGGIITNGGIISGTILN